MPLDQPTDVTHLRATVPASVVSNVRRRWPDRADDWTRQVEDELHELCVRYKATPRRVLPARYGFVVAADTANGGLVVRASPDPDGPNQARVAAALADLGIAPTVHEAINTDTGIWTILDEVRPATPLADAPDARATVDSLAAPLAAMVGLPAPAPGMPTIIEWLRGRLEDDHATDLAPGAERAPARARRAAATMLEQLAADTTPQLCHGDVSPWNVLAHGADGWMLIDPRGMSGDVCYDVAVLSLKTIRRRQAAPTVARLAEAVGVDPERALAWTTVIDAARV